MWQRAVPDWHQWLESFTAVPNLGLPLLNVIELLLETLAINNDDKETCGNAVALMDFPLSKVPKSVFLRRPITEWKIIKTQAVAKLPIYYVVQFI